MLDRRVEVAPRAGPAVHAEQVRRPFARGRVGDRDSVIGQSRRARRTSCAWTVERTYASAAANASASAIASSSVSAAPCARARAQAASPSADAVARDAGLVLGADRAATARAGALPDRLLGAVQPGRAEVVPRSAARHGEPSTQTATPQAFSSATKVAERLAVQRARPLQVAQRAGRRARGSSGTSPSSTRRRPRARSRRSARGCSSASRDGPRARRASRGSPARARPATRGRARRRARAPRRSAAAPPRAGRR